MTILPRQSSKPLLAQAWRGGHEGLMPSNFTPYALFEHKAARLLLAVFVCQGAKPGAIEPPMPEVVAGSVMPSMDGCPSATDVANTGIPAFARVIIA